VKIVLSFVILLFSFAALPSWAQDAAAQADAKQTQLASLDADAALAKQRVIEIINQPVMDLPARRRRGCFRRDGFIPAPSSRISVKWTSAQRRCSL
jgi:hypothetical protein